ncbi:MAG: PIG-L family deacetylase [Sphingobacteriales bacterium]|nr:PIG-L family deacetylase [Sphingobacteriales bacterium]
MRKLLLVFLFTIHHSLFTKAQTPATFSASDIYLGLKKLKVLGSVLYLAAHPDDENTRLLAYLSKDRLYRTGYMSMTRGDGGQNLIGDEQGIELGLIRTQELLAARRIDGAEQFFSRAFYFGCSKSTDEALKTWDKEKILSDVVWVIRKFQPDVMITRFPEDSRAGHGHHSGSAVLAREAFIAAADPNRFPEQLKYGVKPWQAKRIMWNTFNFGGNNTTSESQLKIDVGTYSTVLGKSFGEIAAESRSQHKSQGFGVPRSRGQQFEYFKLTLGDSASKDLLDGVITDWSRVEGGAAIAAQIDAVIKNYSFDNPSASVDALLNLYKTISKLQLADNYWKERKMQETQQLIEACAGLYAEGTTTEQYVAQGDTLKINYTVIDRSNTKIVLKGYYQFDGDAPQGDTYKSSLNELNKELEPNKNLSYSKTIMIDPNHEISQPYWLKEEMSKGSFNVSDQKLIGMAQSKPSLEVVFVVNIGGEDFYIRKPVQYKFTDPVKGELFQPLVIVPPLAIKVQPLLKLNGGDYNVEYKANKSLENIKVLNDQTKTIIISDDNAMKKFELRQSQQTIHIDNVYKMDGTADVIDYKVNFSEASSKDIKSNLRTISYDHIPSINYFQESSIRFLKMSNFKTTGKTIGYIVGAGDKVPEALTQMGYTVTTLGEKDITADNLKKFDAVVAGVRTYNVHDYMVNAYDALMEYVKQGGVYVVQYNTNSFAGPLANGKIGPAPFTITRNRITDEEAKVNFLQPDNAVLNYPNKITEKDFVGWVQERSIYEADKVDSSYASILSFNDPGEQPTSGSLIVTNYGKGKFVYTGLVFFRELPAGVPGAYRLFANILAKPQKQVGTEGQTGTNKKIKNKTVHHKSSN